MLKGEKVGRNDQDVSAATSRDRVSSAIRSIVLSSEEEDDPVQEEPEMNVVGGQDLNLFYEDEYRLMNEDGDYESNEPDEARGDDTFNEELNGNLFFEEEYRRLSGVN